MPRADRRFCRSGVKGRGTGDFEWNDVFILVLQTARTASLLECPSISAAQAELQTVSAPPGNQIEDKNCERDHKKNMDYTSGDVETESQEPQYQQHNKDCPKHIYPLQL